jgi:hypothetical protein
MLHVTSFALHSFGGQQLLVGSVSNRTLTNMFHKLLHWLQGHALETVEEVVAAAPASDTSLHAAPPQSMNTSPSVSPSPASPAQQQQQQEGNKPGAGAGGKGSPGSPRSPSKLQSQGSLLSKVRGEEE